MSKKVYGRMMAGLNEALEIAKGNAKPARLYVPAEIDVQKLRKKLGFTQQSFVREYGFTLNQIREWEQGRTRPLDAMRAYLMIIERDPKGVSNLLRRRRARVRKNRAVA